MYIALNFIYTFVTSSISIFSTNCELNSLLNSEQCQFRGLTSNFQISNFSNFSNPKYGTRNSELGTLFYLFNSIIIFNVRSKKTIFAFAFCSICRSANPNSIINCSTFRSFINGENRFEKSDSNDVK